MKKAIVIALLGLAFSNAAMASWLKPEDVMIYYASPNNTEKKLEITYSFCIPTDLNVECIGKNSFTLPSNYGHVITIPKDKKIVAVVFARDVSTTSPGSITNFSTCRSDLANKINTLILEKDQNGNITCIPIKTN